MRLELKKMLEGVVLDREGCVALSLGIGIQLGKLWARRVGPELLAEQGLESERLLSTGDDISPFSLPRNVRAVVKELERDYGIIDFPSFTEAWHRAIVGVWRET